MSKPEDQSKQSWLNWDNIKKIIYILSAIEFSYLIFYFLFIVLPFSLIWLLIEYFSESDSMILLYIMKAVWFYIPIAFVLIYTIYYCVTGKPKKSIEDMKEMRKKDIEGR